MAWLAAAAALCAFLVAAPQANEPDLGQVLSGIELRYNSLATLQSEFEQAMNYYSRRSAEQHLKLAWTDAREIAPGSSTALGGFAYFWMPEPPAQFPARQKLTIYDNYRIDPAERTLRQLNELITHTQRTLAVVHRDREKLWADVRPKAKDSTPEQWEKICQAGGA